MPDPDGVLLVELALVTLPRERQEKIVWNMLPAAFPELANDARISDSETDNVIDLASAASRRDEFEGVAHIHCGRIFFDIEEIPAKTDAERARRLVYIVLYAYLKLAGIRGVSSRRVLVPLLEGFDLNTANTRRLFADKDKKKLFERDPADRDKFRFKPEKEAAAVERAREYLKEVRRDLFHDETRAR